MSILSKHNVNTIGPVEYMPMKHYRACFDVNYFGYINVTQAFLPLLRVRICLTHALLPFPSLKMMRMCAAVSRCLSRPLAISLFLALSLSLVVVIVALYFVESMLTITVAMNSDMAAALKAKLLEHWADVRHQLRQ